MVRHSRYQQGLPIWTKGELYLISESSKVLSIHRYSTSHSLTVPQYATNQSFTLRTKGNLP